MSFVNERARMRDPSFVDVEFCLVQEMDNKAMKGKEEVPFNIYLKDT